MYQESYQKNNLFEVLFRK